ncbi:MAG TPA: hypothetical protein VHW66_14130 [Stellaceae bacterium]|jgi:hypothetical protein|nr:hypothetical protein [Stellaceae bacterium]
MPDIAPNTGISSHADLFREEAERARRYVATTRDRSVIEQLTQIARIYENLAAGQTPGPTDRD